MTEVSYPSLLLQEIREAIHASGFPKKMIPALTGGAVTLRTIYNLLADDGIHPNLGNVQALARGLSHAPKTLAYWQQNAHPVGEACVAYWTEMYRNTASTSRRSRARQASLLRPKKTLQRRSVKHPLYASF